MIKHTQIQLLPIIMLWVLLCHDVFSQTIEKDITVEKYPNGKIKFQVPVKNNMKNGLGKAYDKMGHLTYEVEFKNDTMVGTMKQYYPNGTILREIDSKTLDAMVYKENGRYYYKGRYDNKKYTMNGKWEEWDAKDNFKRFEWTYLNDVINGPYTAFRKDGSIEAMGSYKNGSIDSVLTYFDTKGICIKKELWKSFGTSSQMVKKLDCK